MAGALAAVDPCALVREALLDFDAAPSAPPRNGGPPVPDRARSTNSGDEPYVRVAAVGKAAWGMIRGAFEMLGPRIREAVVVAPGEESSDALPPHRFFRGGHPLPDEGSVAGARAVLDLVRGAAPDERIVFLLSGGASALLTLPPDDVSLDDLALTSRLLMEAGADIVELNTVRKHLDRVKGGGLARAAAPISLWAGILSDVVGDRLDVIGSGPVTADPTTFDDALEIVRARIPDDVPSVVLDHLERGARGELPETPGEGDPCFDAVDVRIIGNAVTALTGAARVARDRGYDVREGSAGVTGEARKVGRELGRIACRLAEEVGPEVSSTSRAESEAPTGGENRQEPSTDSEARRSPEARPRGICHLSAGETTVRVAGHGRGGPNQEVALAAALELAGASGPTPAGVEPDPEDRVSGPPGSESRGVDMLVSSIGTDGIDGPTGVAGAVADPTTVRRARRAGMSPEAALERNDSYPFFQALGDHIRTGPTGTNVMDLHVVLVGERGRSFPGR